MGGGRAAVAVCATGWDAGALLRLKPHGTRPDITMHFPVEAWADYVVAHGVAMPPHSMAIAPNVSKPRSRGCVWITSALPEERPGIDYQYFTDPGGADEAVLVAAVRSTGVYRLCQPSAIANGSAAWIQTRSHSSHPNPTAAIKRPVALPGRRSNATTPTPMSAAATWTT